MSRPPVGVVVLNYNNAQRTIRCLGSLQRLTYEPHSVVVVDNASTDRSPMAIRKTFPGAEMVVSPHNRGFGAGNNIGISCFLTRQAPYVWLLNNDTEVDSHSLSHMVRRMESDSRLGILGSLVFEIQERERIQSAGGGRVLRRLAITRDNLDLDGGDLNFVSGVSMLIRREVLEEIGGFDERFFLYLEDVDLCVRAADAGWKLAVEPEARVWHEGGATTGAKGTHKPTTTDRVYAASTAGFIRKHGGTLWPAWLALRATVMVLHRLVGGRASHLSTVLGGMGDGISAFGSLAR